MLLRSFNLTEYHTISFTFKYLGRKKYRKYIEGILNTCHLQIDQGENPK